MSTPLPLDPQLPTRADAELAQVSSRTLAAIMGPATAERLRVVIGRETIEVPVAALKLFAEVLAQMALGRAVQIVPHTAELTTQQAADFLNVSRPFLIKRLEAGELAYHMAGTHRRIFFRDLLAFRTHLYADQDAALDEMLALSPEKGWNRDA